MKSLRIVDSSGHDVDEEGTTRTPVLEYECSVPGRGT